MRSTQDEPQTKRESRAGRLPGQDGGWWARWARWARLWRRIPWDALRTRLILAGLALAVMLLVPSATPAGNTLEARTLGQVRDVLFNFAAWEIEALAQKIRQERSGLAPFMTEAERSAFVVAYQARITELAQLSGEIERVYSDPAIADPEAASAELRARHATLTAEVEARQLLAAAIVETQIATVLRDEGFGVLGEVLPPVSAHLTSMPNVLIISPRNVIRRELSVVLVGLSPDARSALESQIDSALDVSSLIVPLGGLAVYPTMVYQTWYTPHLFETVAHEWLHNYLMFFPLGLQYMDEAGETLTINETTASLFGREIGRRTVERFYGDYPEVLAMLPPEEPIRLPDTAGPSASATPTTSVAPATPTPTPGAEPAPATPAPFDFASALNETRLAVDALLAAGQVEEAEAYMEARRRYFAENGIVIRKLNQAYFAFYGGYQLPGGGGAAGDDPIGPAVAEIRARSGSLQAWVVTMRSITSRAALLAARDTLRGR